MIPVRFLIVSAEGALLELEGQMPGLPHEGMLLVPDGINTMRTSVVSWSRDSGVEVVCEHVAGRPNAIENRVLVDHGWVAVGMREPK